MRKWVLWESIFENTCFGLRVTEVSDELSAFAMFGNLLHACEESNDFFDITQDPAFANRYYRKMLDYVFDGTDLNPLY